MHRRDFFHPGRIVSAAGHVLGLLEDSSSPSSPGPTAVEAALLRFSRRAMATTFEVFLPFWTPHAAEAAEAALDEIDRLEKQPTIYRDSSEVSRLNRLAPFTALRVEDGLFDLHDETKTIHDET